MENIEIGRIKKGQAIKEIFFLNKIKKFYKNNSIIIWVVLGFNCFAIIDFLLIFKFINIITTL